jgi:hypothetical protein
MKTSIFDMNFVLPPVVEMHDVMKDMPMLPMLPMGSKFGFLYLNC